MGKIEGYIKHELAILPIMKMGYSRYTSSQWLNRCKDDNRYWEKSYGEEQLKKAHEAGFLVSSLKRYGIDRIENTSYISDLDYLSLTPFNNSFTKWIEDIYTASRVLKEHSDVFRTIYYSIIQREGSQIILPNGGAEREHSAEDIRELVKEKQHLELRPVFWKSVKKRYDLTFAEDKLFVNGKETPDIVFKNIIKKLNGNYVVADPVDIFYNEQNGITYDHTIKLWIANDSARDPEIKSATLTLYWNDIYGLRGTVGRRVNETVLVNPGTGEYTFEDEYCVIPDWDRIVEKVKAVSNTIRQINFYTMSIALNQQGSFKIVHFDGYPNRPQLPYNDELNEYFKSKVKKQEYSFSEAYKAFKKAFDEKKYARHVRKCGRKGIRPYMQKIWEENVKDDMRHTKGAGFFKKRWMHKQGFYSYRIWQYGITKENYKDFVLSDYDYFWLNRINNDYQKWVNDKTTYRMIMEPLKEFVPKYYFSVFKVAGETRISRQFDLPDGIEESFEGAMKLLKDKGKLAYKPSAGTHGDGFYCLEYHDDAFWANGEEKTEEEMREIILGQKSFYVLTEYINMHDDLKKIYANSVNTIRVIVVNSHGYDPKIMQQYFRIGSLRTGYTDNVGYGGICAMINNDTGEIYDPQSIKDHYFYDCPVHPDTGTAIGGKLPNWDMMCEAILKISRYLGELEYLGYDVAITNEGMEILEINIHPDLHKVNEMSDEFKEFFAHQKSRKAKSNRILL